MSNREQIKNLIGGELCAPMEGIYQDNFNPATGEIYSQVPRSTAADVASAVKAAETAFPQWSELPPATRSQYLRKLAEAIRNQQELFAEVESRDNGKPISLARSLDIPRSSVNFEFFADWLTQFSGPHYRISSELQNYVEYSPLGVVSIISPWNLPLYSFTWKIAPALAAGNTVIAKPSELTPMSAFLFSKLAKDILPKGVLNILHGLGPEVGAPMVTHPNIKAVSFTGSTATGKSISQATAGTFKKLSLEMGGKNPTLVFADANFQATVEGVARAAFLNQGQICLCGSRIFVERPVYEKFKLALMEKAKSMKIGDPLQSDTEMGALISEAHREKVLSYIELAKTGGGKILCGGRIPENLPLHLKKGYFLEPTLIEGLGSESRVNQEEIFGPVATLIPFDTEEEALQMANSTKHGLSASVWTENHSRAQRLSRKLQAGVVWINCWMVRDLRTPFGGVKESGMGREGGDWALQFFSDVKTICQRELPSL